MARCALIKDGTVVNVIVVDADDVVILKEDSPVSSGDKLVDGEFIKSIEPEQEDPLE